MVMQPGVNFLSSEWYKQLGCWLSRRTPPWVSRWEGCSPESGIQRWGGILGLGHCRHLWVGHCWGWIGGHWGEWQNLKVREQRRRSLHRSLRRLRIERRPERRLPPSTTGLSMFLVGSPYCSHWDSQPAMATNQMFNVTKWICQFYLLHYFDFLYIII